MSPLQVNGMLLEGKKVFVGPFLKRTERPIDKEQHYTNVFVKNLSENVSDEELEKMFNEHGTVRTSVPSLKQSVWMSSIMMLVASKGGGQTM